MRRGALVLLVLGAIATPGAAQEPPRDPPPADDADLRQEVADLRALVIRMQARIDALETRLQGGNAAPNGAPPPASQSTAAAGPLCPAAPAPVAAPVSAAPSIVFPTASWRAPNGVATTRTAPIS
jgi:hypothetical protein